MVKDLVVIIDYGMGNLHSIETKIEKLKYNVIISGDENIIIKGTKLILPGVGYFAQGMKNIKDYKLLDVLNKRVLKDKIPILGICLGMQLLTKFSEEGNSEGLKWIDANTKRFDFSKISEKLRIPHVGWDTLSIKKKSILFKDIPSDVRFYFTHSYCVTCKNNNDIAAITNYGYDFVSTVEKNNIYGTQFHPEKSHSHGLKMIDNFLRIS